MSVILAAIDNSAAARPVLDFAHELAALMGADVEAVHVDGPEIQRTAADNAHALHLPFHRRRGAVTATIVATASERDAIAVVIGARGTPAGAAPAGHVTIELVQALDVPVAIVPPQFRPGPIRRALVAVEGDGESHALHGLVRHLGRPRRTVEMVAVHVFTPERLPMFGDQPVHETEAWADDFERRVLAPSGFDVKLELRAGDAPRALRAAAQELDADLVILAWHRNLGQGHGRLVRMMLAESEVPLLLMPID